MDRWVREITQLLKTVRGSHQVCVWGGVGRREGVVCGRVCACVHVHVHIVCMHVCRCMHQWCMYSNHCLILKQTLKIF